MKMENDFHLMGFKMPYRSRFAWAYSVFPGIGKISERCDVCGNGSLYPGLYPERPLAVKLEKGKLNPDILGCGAYPFLILSERVLDAFSSQGIGSYTAFPMEVIIEPGSQRPTPPRYFHVKITGRCEMDIEAMEIKVLDRCPKCLYHNIEPMAGYPFVFKQETWDGSDLFAGDLFPMQLICTKRVVALVQKYKWTNFRFELPEDQKDEAMLEAARLLASQ